MAKRFKESKKKKNKKIKWYILIILAIILIISIINLGINKWNMQKTVSGMISTVTGEEVDTIYALILGISEDIESELTDTIILCAYNPYTQNAYMVSIPRDTYIGKNSTVSMYDKINAVYAKYGIEKTIEHVEQLTNTEIDYYAIVRTSALIDIVDIIGGVEFDVPINMKYDDKSQNLHINLKKGLQKIDGQKAEQLLRFRHNNDGTSYSYQYGDNDYGRMKTQREFIKQTIKQTIQFKNIGKINKIINAIFDNVETNITLSKLLAYVPYGVEFNIEKLKMEQLPGVSVLKKGVWVFEKDINKTNKLMENLENTLNGHIEVENTNGPINSEEIEKNQYKK